MAPVSATDVWAVGSYNVNSNSLTQTLIEHWNGRKWTLIPSPNPGLGGNFLFGISAISARNIWAVGYYNPTSASSNSQTLIEHWNGIKWSVVSSPYIASAYNILNAVTAISPSNVWAVGDANHQTLIEQWNGTSWSIVPSPNLSNYNDLYQVSAIAANDIWTVGGAGVSTLIEHWDGTSWSIVSSASPGSGVKYLNGVTAISSTNVWAGGAAQTGSNGEVQTLIEHWDGTGWSVVPSPNPEPSNTGILNAVVRVPKTSSQIWAVGSYTDSNNPGQTLTEFYC